MLRVLIVENETDPAEILKSHLLELYDDVEVLDICGSVETSLKSINKHSPDLVFLDIELDNNENGFEILKRIDEIKFEIIVTTAFDKYAILACRASVIDFLVKPISKEELYTAVNKFKGKRSLRNTDLQQQTIDPSQIKQFIEIYKGTTLAIGKFPLPTMTGYDFVDTMKIVYFEGAGTQTYVNLINRKKECISMLLKECEKLLSHSNFFRIHKSYYINLTHVEKYLKGKDGTVVMSNSDHLPVSRECKDDFLKHIKGL